MLLVRMPEAIYLSGVGRKVLVISCEVCTQRPSTTKTVVGFDMYFKFSFTVFQNDR
jgi:hypothetical protein